ncbi:MAG: hypothetical protein ACFCUU_00345 [Cyclobacteriaceae bacterium]
MGIEEMIYEKAKKEGWLEEHIAFKEIVHKLIEKFCNKEEKNLDKAARDSEIERYLKESGVDIEIIFRNYRAF